MNNGTWKWPNLTGKYLYPHHQATLPPSRLLYSCCSSNARHLSPSQCSIFSQYGDPGLRSHWIRKDQVFQESKTTHINPSSFPFLQNNLLHLDAPRAKTTYRRPNHGFMLQRLQIDLGVLVYWHVPKRRRRGSRSWTSPIQHIIGNLQRVDTGYRYGFERLGLGFHCHIDLDLPLCFSSFPLGPRPNTHINHPFSCSTGVFDQQRLCYFRVGFF